jgi:NAD(P)-dependent dehydrogenase (short-subunit alcohol dehydrogenase family)
LITGASGGIGRACAVHLSQVFPSAEDQRPLVLVLSGRRQGELEETAKQTREGTTTEIVVGDVSKEEDVVQMFKLVKEKYGRVDIVFNVGLSGSLTVSLRGKGGDAEMQNAGVDLLKGVATEDADIAKFRQVLDVNVMSAVIVRHPIRLP